MALLKGVRPVLHWGRDLFYRGQDGRVRSCPWTSAGVEAKESKRKQKKAKESKSKQKKNCVSCLKRKKRQKKEKGIECYQRMKALDGWECWMLSSQRSHRESPSTERHREREEREATDMAQSSLYRQPRPTGVKLATPLELTAPPISASPSSCPLASFIIQKVNGPRDASSAARFANV